MGFGFFVFLTRFFCAAPQLTEHTLGTVLYNFQYLRKIKSLKCLIAFSTKQSFVLFCVTQGRQGKVKFVSNSSLIMLIKVSRRKLAHLIPSWVLVSLFSSRVFLGGFPTDRKTCTWNRSIYLSVLAQKKN